MAHVLSDRVKETSTTTGTGTLTLAGAVANFRTFTSVLANGDTTLYAIIHQSANEWEVGLGTFTTSGTTLARTTVLGSSNGGAAVNLSAGTKHVAITLTTAGRIPGIAFTSAITPATNDAAALGSGSGTLMWSDLFLATGGVISWNNGDVTLTHATNNLTFSGGSLTMTVTGNLVMSASSGTTPPLTLTSGTLMTTPTDGAMEADAECLYFTSDAGNRGLVNARHMIRTNANRTYTSNTSSQKIFDAPTNGRLTLETGTYRFEGLFSWSSMSATIGNRSIELLGAGTAVLAVPIWTITGWDGVTAAGNTGSVQHVITNSSGASCVTATTGASLIAYVTGSFEVSTAGTLIPSTTMVTAAASILNTGSWLEIWRVGDQARVSVGQWD